MSESEVDNKKVFRLKDREAASFNATTLRYGSFVRRQFFVVSRNGRGPRARYSPGKLVS